jgi:hypothetical protein
LKAAEQQARVLHLPRAKYIRHAISAMNDSVIAQQKREHLMSVSRRVAANSITINAEFEAIEDAPNA